MIFWSAMEGRRNIVIMLVAGVLLAGILVFVMRDDVRLAARDAWERGTGQTVTVIDTDTGEQSVMSETSYTEEVADDEEDISDEEDEQAVTEEETSQDEEAVAIEQSYADAWTAEARGYLSVESQECPPWESCGEVKIAYFVVTDTKSSELSAYLGVPDGDAARFPIGCDEQSVIRFVAYEEMAASERREITGELLVALRGSSKSAPVALRISKAVWPADGGTEGPLCTSPFAIALQ